MRNVEVHVTKFRVLKVNRAKKREKDSKTSRREGKDTIWKG